MAADIEVPARPPIKPDADPAALLQNVIGAVLSGIVQGQSQADLATLAVAALYSRHPQLVHFPICRAQMQEIDMTLNVAMVGGSPSLTPQARAELATMMLRQANIFLDGPPLGSIVDTYPQLTPAWYCALPRTMERVAQTLDRIRGSDANSVASELLLVFANAFFAVVGEFPDILRTLRPRFPEILDAIQSNDLPELKENVALILEANALQPSVRVLYTADELADLPQAAIDQVRIRVLPQLRQLITVDGQLRVSVE